MLGKFFAGTVGKIVAGIIALLLLIIGFQWWALSVANSARDDCNERAGRILSEAERDRALLKVLQDEMAKAVYEGALTEDRLAEARAKQADVIAQMQDEAETIRTAPVEDDCRTSPAIMQSRNL